MILYTVNYKTRHPTTGDECTHPSNKLFYSLDDARSYANLILNASVMTEKCPSRRIIETTIIFDMEVVERY